MQYICICIHIMRMHLPIGHRRNARLNEADRQSNHPESAAETMGQRDNTCLPFLTLFRPSEANPAAGAPILFWERPRLRISSNKQKQVREVSVRFMVIGGEPPKKIDIRQNACYSLSK